jgi:hypothetical protein
MNKDKNRKFLMYVIPVLIRMAYNCVCYANNLLVDLEICSIKICSSYLYSIYWYIAYDICFEYVSSIFVYVCIDRVFYARFLIILTGMILIVLLLLLLLAKPIPSRGIFPRMLLCMQPLVHHHCC